MLETVGKTLEDGVMTPSRRRTAPTSPGPQLSNSATTFAVKTEILRIATRSAVENNKITLKISVFIRLMSRKQG